MLRSGVGRTPAFLAAAAKRKRSAASTTKKTPEKGDESIARDLPASGTSQDAIAPNPNAKLPFAPCLDDYHVELSPPRSRAQCAVCNATLKEGELRVGSYAKGTGDYRLVTWSHLGCAYTTVTRLHPGSFGNITNVGGVTELPSDAIRDDVVRLAVRGWHPQPTKADFGAAFTKAPFSAAISAAGEDAKALAALSKRLRDIRSALEDTPTSALREVLVKNLPPMDDAFEAKVRKWDRTRVIGILADYAAFGVPGACKSCGGGALIPQKDPHFYRCAGSIDEFTACNEEYLEVKRTLLKLPAGSEFRALEKLCEVRDDRSAPGASAAASAAVGLRNLLGSPTFDLRARAAAIDVDPASAFAGICFLPKSKSVISKALATRITDAGGVVSAKPKPGTVLTIGVADDNAGANVTGADFSVTPQWVSDSLDVGRALSLAEGIDELVPVPHLSTTKQQWLDQLRDAAGGKTAKDDDGAAVVSFAGTSPIDAECSLAGSEHAFLKTSDGFEFNATFNKVDVATGANSFYVLQVIDLGGGRAMLFRRWGRLGERTGKKEERLFAADACHEFAKYFEGRTGVPWSERQTFTKKPGFYNWVNQPSAEDESAPSQAAVTTAAAGATTTVQKSKATLAPATKKLLDLLFDEDEIEKTMTTMQIDTKKMPLAGLTLGSVKAGEKALSAIEALQKEAARAKSAAAKKRALKLIVASSNRFYSSVPHVIPDTPEGRAASLLDTPEKLAEKVQLVDDLRSILFTKTAMKQTGASGDVDDSRYTSLNSTLEWLDPTSEDAKMVVKYAKNTHGSTHRRFTVKHVWRLERHGEDARYAKWSANKNRKLLWHGSRLTNWVNIMAQGLRIAPPEAPATGYMFGKGVYFADMFTKSANYCFGDHGLLCLAEVALGKMQERTRSHYVEKLDAPYHSTYALGETYPDPDQDVTLPGGVVMPTGTPTRRSLYTSLLYNEFIVYDISQIRVRYLVEVDRH